MQDVFPRAESLAFFFFKQLLGLDLFIFYII